MAILTLRTDQPGPLEFEQVDANFTNLNNDKLENDGGTFVNGFIDNAEISNSTIDTTDIGNTTPASGSFSSLSVPYGTAKLFFTTDALTTNTANQNLQLDLREGNRELNLGANVTFEGLVTAQGIIDLHDDLSIEGVFSKVGTHTTSLTTTDTTALTLPTSGTLYGTKLDSITSAQLASSLSDETGIGSVVFNTSPTIIGSIITTAAEFNFARESIGLNIGSNDPSHISSVNILTGVSTSPGSKTVDILTGTGTGSRTLNIGNASSQTFNYGKFYSPGMVVQTVYLRGNDTAISYAYPVASTSTVGTGGNTAGGAEITRLTQAITPYFTNSHIKLTYEIMFEATTDVTFVISRNGVVISRSTVNSAFAGSFTTQTAANTTTTPDTNQFSYMDLSPSAGVNTYRLHVQSATTGTGTLWYNRATSTLASGVEGGISQVWIEEIAR